MAVRPATLMRGTSSEPVCSLDLLQAPASLSLSPDRTRAVVAGRDGGLASLHNALQYD